MGLSGIVGGLFMFAGDMLYYYDPVSVNLKLNMAHGADIRIMLNGLTALLGTWFYLLGLGQVYFAFRPAPALVRNTVLASFAAILTAYGVIHGNYVAIAVSSKLALQYHLDMEAATALASNSNLLIRYFVYPPFAVLSLVFIFQVWKQKTLYPRWIILFFPLIPFLINLFVGRYFTGSAFIIVEGGFYNLILIAFFVASTIALWDSKQTAVKTK